MLSIRKNLNSPLGEWFWKKYFESLQWIFTDSFYLPLGKIFSYIWIKLNRWKSCHDCLKFGPPVLEKRVLKGFQRILTIFRSYMVEICIYEVKHKMINQFYHFAIVSLWRKTFLSFIQTYIPFTFKTIQCLSLRLVHWDF